MKIIIGIICFMLGFIAGNRFTLAQFLICTEEQLIAFIQKVYELRKRKQ